MSFPQILEVAIGVMVVYYVLSAIVSYITQMIIDLTEKRGVALELHLIRMGEGFSLSCPFIG